MALPNPEPELQHPHISGHPLIPDPTKNSNPPTKCDEERLESLYAQSIYDIQDGIARMRNTVSGYVTLFTEVREMLSREQEAQNTYLSKRDVVVDPQPEDVPVPEEIEETDWEGNFTRPEGPRPQPDSAPF